MRLLTQAISAALRIPVAGKALRWLGGRYQEGSVTTIPFGVAAGARWKRSHKYVSGYWSGLYELEIQLLLSRELGPGMTFYDVGANAGFFTVLAAKLVGSEGMVVAFEPLADNVRSIENQVALNGFSHCKVVACAVSDATGQGFLKASRNTSMARLSCTPGGGDDGEVETVCLNDAIADLPFPNFIKVDVEGAEADVLQGATNLLSSRSKPRWLIELHGNEAGNGAWKLLSKYGYTVSDVTGNVLRAVENLPRHIFAFAS